MNQRRNTVRKISPWLLVLYFILSTWLGGALISHLLHNAGRSFHTLIMLGSLVIGCGLQSVIDTLGHILGGVVSGCSLQMVKFGSRTLVKEQGHFVLRESTPENTFLPVIMTDKKETAKVYPLTILGGAVLSYLSAILSFVILRSGIVSMESVFGTFLLAMILSGLWAGTFALLPAYLGYAPNDGLNYLILKHDPLAAKAFSEDKKLIRLLDETEEQIPLPYPDTDEDQDDRVMSMFRACYLFRSCERLIWEGKVKEASEIMAVLYYHLDDFTDEWQMIVIREAVFILCMIGEGEENQLADRLLTPGRRKVYERNLSSESLRTLLLWSMHHVEMKSDAQKYYAQLDKKVEDVAYEKARGSWRHVVNELPLRPMIQ